MAVNAGAPRQQVAATFPPIPLRRRLYGFGSIYGKTIRDSRLAFIIAAGLLGGLALVMGAAIATIFPTPQSRLERGRALRQHPGVADASVRQRRPIGSKVGTLGGYVTFKYGAIFALGTAVWSILALSGTLAGEARRGSLDFVAAAPFGKRRIGLEKLAAPPHPAVAGDADPRTGDHLQLERIRRCRTRRRDLARVVDRLRTLGRLPGDVLRWPGVRAVPVARSCRRGRRRRRRHGRDVDHQGLQRGRSAVRAEPVRMDVQSRPARRHLRLAVRRAGWRSSASCSCVDRDRALPATRPRRDRRSVAARPAGSGPRRARPDDSRVRRAAPARARVGHRPRSHRHPLRVFRRRACRPGRRTSRASRTPSALYSRTSI